MNLQLASINNPVNGIAVVASAVEMAARARLRFLGPDEILRGRVRFS